MGRLYSKPYWKIYDSVGVEDITGKPILRNYARTSIVHILLYIVEVIQIDNYNYFS